MKHLKKIMLLIVFALVPTIAFADSCPLGEDVTKDLVGVLRIMKILAPILVFVFSGYDAVVALTKKDIDAQAKAIFIKFAKRIAVAVLLFAIPVLVDSVMQLLNVWDADGHCTFDEVQSSGSADQTVGTEPPNVVTGQTGESPEVNTQQTGGSPEVNTQQTGGGPNVNTNTTNNTNKVRTDTTGVNPSVNTNTTGGSPSVSTNPVIIIN